MEALKSLLSEFDPAALMPKLDTVLGKIELITRLAVLIGPLVLLVLGLLYLFLAPKEANHSFGYRCYFGMGSVEAWQFAQRIGGLVWAALGFTLTVVMLLIVSRYRKMQADAMILSALHCILWEIGLVLVSRIGVDAVLMRFFDKDGNRRPGKKK